MQEQSKIKPQQSIHKQPPYTTLSSKPTCYFSNQKQIYVSLSDLSVQIFNIQKQSFKPFLLNLHQKRINCIKQKNNILITGSNDFTIKLWDVSSGKTIHKFQKPGSQFNCLDISQHILTAAHTSKLAFWDLRKMKQRQQFNQSFNGQITTIQFDPNVVTNFMACSVDGMISKFDLKQPNQQQAFMWCTKILQSPSKLQFINNISLIQTTNHQLFFLQQQAIKKTIIVNNFQQPKHILNSKLFFRNNKYDFQYFSWNLQKQLVEKISDQKVVGYVHNVVDTQIFVPLANYVIYIQQNGQVFIKPVLNSMKKPNKEHKSLAVFQRSKQTNGKKYNKKHLQIQTVSFQTNHPVSNKKLKSSNLIELQKYSQGKNTHAQKQVQDLQISEYQMLQNNITLKLQY